MADSEAIASRTACSSQKRLSCPYLRDRLWPRDQPRRVDLVTIREDLSRCSVVPQPSVAAQRSRRLKLNIVRPSMERIQATTHAM